MDKIVTDCSNGEVKTTPLTQQETTQRAAEEQQAQTVVAAQETQQKNETTLRGKLDSALTNLQAYRAQSAPTAAQTTAVVKLLCGITVWLIRLRLGKLDAVD